MIKGRATQERLRKDPGAPYVEIERTGMMDGVLCLAIRGIYDCADSLENNHLRMYAAAAAALYMKEL